MHEFEYQDVHLTIMDLVTIKGLKMVIEKGTTNLFQVTVFDDGRIVAQVECDKIGSDLIDVIEGEKALTE